MHGSGATANTEHAKAIVYSHAIPHAGDRVAAGAHRQARDVARRRRHCTSMRCPVSIRDSPDPSNTIRIALRSREIRVTMVPMGMSSVSAAGRWQSPSMPTSSDAVRRDSCSRATASKIGRMASPVSGGAGIGDRFRQCVAQFEHEAVATIALPQVNEPYRAGEHCVCPCRPSTTRRCVNGRNRVS